MKVLHGIWIGKDRGSFHLFAQDDEVALKRKGRPRAIQRHPNMMEKEELNELFVRISGDRVPLKSSDIVLDLPSENELHKGKTPLSRYAINTLALDLKAAIDWLLDLPTSFPHDVAIGDSIRVWSEASKLSLEMLAGQRFYPSIAKDGTAVWSIAPDGNDLERMGKMAKAMPRICVLNGEGKSPRDILLDIINQTADSFIKETIHDRWRKKSGRVNQAVIWWDGLVSGEFDNLEKTEPVSRRISSWSSSIVTSSERPFRACFKLDPPETGRNRWNMGFFLQSMDDPSLLIPASTIWEGGPGEGEIDARRILLEDLGKASRIYHPLERTLNRAYPVGMTVTTVKAYAFLREIAPLLQQSGLGIMLPAWWNTKVSRPGIKIKIKKENGTNAGFGMQGLLAYDWSLAIGDQDLSLGEFERLSRMKIPLVRIKGQWVEIRKEDVEKAIEYFKKKRSLTVGELLRLGSGIEDGRLGLGVTTIEGNPSFMEFLNKLKGWSKIEKVKVPSSFKGKLRPYQERGFWWMEYLKKHGLGACLADDMGLGKTIQMIVVLLDGKRKGLSLVVCPMTVLGNWSKELARFSPALKVLIHHGPDRMKGKELVEKVRDYDVIVTTYALLTKDVKDLSTIGWDNLVVDEAQNIKNHDAKQTRAVKSIKANFRVAMTGTPVENRLSELWSIMDFANPGYLGGAEAFSEQFAKPIERFGDRDRSGILKSLVQPFVLRRLKTDKTIIKDLPEKNEMKVFYNLTKEQGTLYQAIVEDMMIRIAEAEAMQRRGIILSTLMKLKQVCNHPAHLLGDGSKLEGRSGKLNRFSEMLEEALSVGDKALVFTQFAAMGEMLHPYLKERFGSALFLHGGTTKKERDRMVERFQDPGGPALFILSLKAGGTGLNLTSASRVFHFDRWWNPAVEDQATDRAYRIGQTKNVSVHKFVCLGTVEERIDRMIEEKKDLAERVVGTGEGWITELSTEKLRELFRLDRSAVMGE